MKKILFMVPSLGMGGMERMLVNVVNALAKREYDITVINLSFDDVAIVENLDSRVNYRNNVCPVKFFLHATIRDWMQGNIRFLPYKYWTKVHSVHYLHKKYIKEKYDTEVAFYTGYSVKIIAGCPVDTRKVFWLHGEAWQMDGMIQGFWRQKVAEKIYKGYDQIVCVSNRIQKDFYKRFGKDCDVTTISNINNIEEIRKKSEVESGLQKDTFTFVSVGRVDNGHKGFDRVLHATKRLNEEGYQFQVWIVGDGADLPKLNQQKEEQSLDNVVLWGQQKNPYKYVKEADVFVCSSNYEGYGLVVSEAIILEKPVLSTNVSGPAEILDDGKYGMLVENTTEGIYQGMKRFLDCPEMVLEYQQKSKARMGFFESDTIIQKIEKVL